MKTNHINYEENWEAHSESDEEESNDHTLKFSELKEKMSNEISVVYNYSSSLDILASYLKSQSFIYNEASNFSRFRLNCLMFPCIFLSSLCSVLSSANEKINHGILYISSINAFISFLLAVVNFLKLDASSEAHQTSSNQYAKLKSLLEFSSGEVLLFSKPILELNGMKKELAQWKDINEPNYELNEENKKELHFSYLEKLRQKKEELYIEHNSTKKELADKLEKKINDVHKKIIEIRESNRFIIPKYITNRYPIISNINIFSFIKNVSNYRDICILRLKDKRNQLRFLSNKINRTTEDNEKIKELYSEKLIIMDELYALSNNYNLVETMIKQEITNNNLFKEYPYLFYAQYIVNFFCCKSSKSLLPNDYKDPYDCGYYDEKQKKSLMRKILNL